MKKYLIIGIIIILVVPFILNFIIIQNVPNGFSVIGDTTDWLQFNGSYIGGTITALISFFILYRTLRYYKTDAEIKRQEKVLADLKNDLKNRFAELNFIKIGNIIYVLDKPNCHKDEIYKLEILQQEIVHSYNTFKFLYDSDTNEKIVAFKEHYYRCIEKMQNCILDVKKIIFCELPYFDTDKKNDTLKKLEQFQNTHMDYQRLYTQLVYTSGQDWIKAEKDKLSQMIENQ